MRDSAVGALRVNLGMLPPQLLLVFMTDRQACPRSAGRSVSVFATLG